MTNSGEGVHRCPHPKKYLRIDFLAPVALSGTVSHRVSPEFPAATFQEMGYESRAVTQKAYNGVAILSRYPIETVSKTLTGEERTIIRVSGGDDSGLRIVNIYLPMAIP